MAGLGKFPYMKIALMASSLNKSYRTMQECAKMKPIKQKYSSIRPLRTSDTEVNRQQAKEMCLGDLKHKTRKQIKMKATECNKS